MRSFMEKALLVTIKLKSERDNNWSLEDITQEMEELSTTSGAQIIDNITCVCEKPTPKLFIGTGKAEEIAAIAQEERVDTVIFSRDLSGVQQRNLEDIIAKKTIDRTQLILDIFAKHAHSPEGKMQVELAQLHYIMPRLIGKGVILSRTGGGIGTSGPGEQKLEVDRRRIRAKIDKLKDDLKHVALHRETLRKKRRENAIPTIALVGYTNAGKSTLLNALTDANQVVADSLFTTLDPLVRNFSLSDGEKIVISDTVGFLNDLPHHLIEAFKATLEEVVQADLLIHVLDVSHKRVYERAKAVINVLRELGAEDKPIITALNKIDLLDDKTWLERLEKDFPHSIPISARLKENFDLLHKQIGKHFSGRMMSVEILIPHSRMDLVDLFYRQAKVQEIKYLQKGIRIKLNLPKLLYHKLCNDRVIEIIS